MARTPIKRGSMMDRMMEKKMGITPGSKADRAMEKRGMKSVPAPKGHKATGLKHFVKGSAAAKAYMAKLRAMRG